ncbi:MAG TPA: polyprenyl synthetase family protein [Clostridiales bacterium]|nr:polyprenyl synthetase family protein [Clostridiales bacterium]
MMDFSREYRRCQRLVEDGLKEYFIGNAPYGELLEAMRYSLLAGGKRIRPVLLLQFCRAAGGDMGFALPLACAVEMLHTYSLIHDDLPCMDNDCLRRGKPTNHIIYGECTATLAGDALQAAAFRTLLAAELPPETVVAAGKTLAEAAGEDGICAGQYLDMKGQGMDLSLEQATLLHDLKTAALLRAAALMGVEAAGGTQEQKTAAGDYATAIGLAFQIRDDILDCTSTTEVLGKPAGSDKANCKTTFVDLLGVEGCEALIRQKTEEAKAAIRGKFSDTDFLEQLADYLAERKS